MDTVVIAPVELTLSAELARFLAYFFYNCFYHFLGISLCVTLNWLPDRINRR